MYRITGKYNWEACLIAMH